MGYSVMIEHSNGKRKLIQAKFDNDEDIIYQFTKGNYACNCNRSIMFNDGDEDCGYNLYKITIFNNQGDPICTEL